MTLPSTHPSMDLAYADRGFNLQYLPGLPFVCILTLDHILKTPMVILHVHGKTILLAYSVSTSVIFFSSTPCLYSILSGPACDRATKWWRKSLFCCCILPCDGFGRDFLVIYSNKIWTWNLIVIVLRTSSLIWSLIIHLANNFTMTIAITHACWFWGLFFYQNHKNIQSSLFLW